MMNKSTFATAVMAGTMLVASAALANMSKEMRTYYGDSKQRPPITERWTGDSKILSRQTVQIRQGSPDDMRGNEDNIISSDAAVNTSSDGARLNDVTPAAGDRE